MKTLYLKATLILLALSMASACVKSGDTPSPTKNSATDTPFTTIPGTSSEALDVEVTAVESRNADINERVEIYFSVNSGSKNVVFVPRSLSVSIEGDRPAMSIERQRLKYRQRLIELNSTFGIHDDSVLRDQLRDEFDADSVTSVFELLEEPIIIADETQLDSRLSIEQETLEVQILAHSRETTQFEATRKTIRSMRRLDVEPAQLSLIDQVIIDAQVIDVKIELSLDCIRLEQGEFFYAPAFCAESHLAWIEELTN